MISLKRAADVEEIRSTLLRAASLILEGVALHSMDVDGSDRRGFQELIRRHANELLAADGNPAGTMVAVGAVIQSMEAFNRKTERLVQDQARELRAMIAMLAAAFGRACRGSGRAIDGIRSVEQHMEKASQLEDIREVKRELADCLAAVGKELERQRAEAIANGAIARTALRDPIVKQATEECQDDPGIDPVTGLPGARQAKNAITAKLGGGNWAAVAAVVDRIEVINTRFGREAGDQVMLFMSQKIASKLRPSDQVFRWHGPCFVALVERGNLVDAVRAEMARALAPKTDHTIELGSRTILVPLSLSWIVIPLWQQESAEEVFRQVENLLKRARG
jgi:diguanylate cyclase (GGDEF)-like protein